MTDSASVILSSGGGHYLGSMLERLKDHIREERGGSHGLSWSLFPSPSRHIPLPLWYQCVCVCVCVCVFAHVCVCVCSD